MTPAEVATERRWVDIPGEYPADPCDCFWHNRRFLFASPPHDHGYARWQDAAVPLARTLSRVDYTDGTVTFHLDTALDGIPIRVNRTVTLHERVTDAVLILTGGGEIRSPSADLRTIVYDAALAGDPLDRSNPAATPRPGHVDPIVIFHLPRHTGYLVVWPEAWWWRPDLEPLTPPDRVYAKEPDRA